MNVIVFGASGATGRELLSQLPVAGHSVTAFARNPAELGQSERVKSVQGDIFDAGAVAKAVAGHDAVLSALGSRSLARGDLLDRGSAYILDGMARAGVRRLIVLGAAGALHPADKFQRLRHRLLFGVVKNTLLRNAMADSAAQERRVEASATDYTIVHPPRLTNGPRRGEYRVLADGLPRDGIVISRADVADFMVRQLKDDTWVRKGPYIAY